GRAALLRLRAAVLDRQLVDALRLVRAPPSGPQLAALRKRPGQAEPRARLRLARERLAIVARAGFESERLHDLDAGGGVRARLEARRFEEKPVVGVLR